MESDRKTCRISALIARRGRALVGIGLFAAAVAAGAAYQEASSPPAAAAASGAGYDHGNGAAAVVGAETARRPAPRDPRYARPTEVPYPADNAYTADRELLGRTLFFDPRLSGSDFISCATCHNPAFSWGDALPRGIGHGMKPLGRRTPTILNLAWGELYFWDGRADSLEAQALGPIASPGEMNLPLDEMIRKLESIPGYEPLFARAYPGEGITTQAVAKAIATFERRVAVSGRAPFDRWVDGDDSAIGADALRGFELFNGKANCAKCHSGWNFTDDGFHDIGVADADVGRGKQMPQIEALGHAFKTPTLRNVAQRAPYLHAGSEPTLESVVEFYDRGGDARRPSLSTDVVPLRLTALEKQDLVAFLRTLTSVDKPVEIPVLPR